MKNLFLKRICALLICICTLASLCVAVNAESTAYLCAEISGDMVLVSGRFVTNQNQPVSITIMLNNTLEQIAQVKTERFGYFESEFAKGDFVEGNTYSINAACLGVSMQADFYYSDSAESGVLSEINTAASASDIKEIVDNSAIILNKQQYNNLSEEAKLNACESLVGVEYSNIADFKTAFYDAVNEEYVKIADVVEFYVSPDGDDDADGLTESTAFATIKRAKDAVKKSLYKGNDCHHTVYLMNGTYYVDDTLVFNEYDSGTEDYKITYKNYSNHKPVLSGSKVISDWDEYGSNGIFVANIGMGLDVKLLYEDGIMQTLARYPNQNKEDLYEGYLEAVKYESSPNTSFSFSAADGIPQTSSSDLEVYIWADSAGYNKWHSKTIPAQIDYSARVVSLDSETYYPIGSGSTYFLQGALEFLDAEGEFFYNKETGELFYKPIDGVIEGKTISIPLAKDIIRFEGATKDTYAHDIVIEGVTIQNSGRSDNLDTNTFYGEFNGNGITIKDSKRIAVKNCVINNVGGSGVYLTGSASYNEISKNEIYNTAVHGVQFVGEEKNLICQENYVINNLIHDTGLLAGIGSGVNVMHTGSGYNYIKNNKIYRTMRYGIRVASNNSPCLYPTYVEYNDISENNMCANDTGAIEVTYQQGGTVIRNNRIHGKQYAEGTGMLFYIDEMNSEVVFEKNILSDIIPGEHAESFVPVVIKGSNNRIENNYIINVPNVYKGVFVLSHQITDAENSTISNNIVYNCGSGMYWFTDNSIFSTSIKTADNNMYYNNGADLSYSVVSNEKNFATWVSSGQDGATLTDTDPLFADVENKDYRLKYNSEAMNLSIEQIDLKNIGLGSDYPIYNTTGEIDRLFINESDVSYESMENGKNTAIKLYARTTNGYLIEVEPEDITYINYNSDIATVNGEGVITAKRSGVAEVIAKVNCGETEKCISHYVIVDGGDYDSLYINRIEYTDINGNGKDSENFTEPLYAYIDVTNCSSSLVEAKALLGVYNNDSLQYAGMSETLEIASQQDGKFIVKYNLPEDTSFDSVKVFFWGENIAPVSKVKAIENTGIK